MRHSGDSGFSLVELAVVLVVIGLVLGGVLGGQSLISAAELRAVTKEHERFQIAFRSFQDMYNAIPGDMANATQYWGRVDDGAFSGQCANPLLPGGTGTQTCNGNGNGELSGNEVFRVWQHLANAELISGQYTGVAGTNNARHHIPGTNCPAFRRSGAGWSMLPGTPTAIVVTGPVWQRLGLDYRTLVIGEPYLSRETYGSGRFSPEEAWSVDSKIDDGMPGTGKLQTIIYENCTTSTDGTDYETARYDLDNKSPACAIAFPQFF